MITRGTEVVAVPTGCVTPFESTQSYVSLASAPVTVDSEAVTPVGQAHTRFASQVGVTMSSDPLELPVGFRESPHAQEVGAAAYGRPSGAVSVARVVKV